MMISIRKETTIDHLLPKRRASGTCVWLLLFLPILLLSACYPSPYRTVSRSAPEATYDNPNVPLTQVYFYPKAGQSAEQQSRDHYDCYNWAVKRFAMHFTLFACSRAAESAGKSTEMRMAMMPMTTSNSTSVNARR